MENSRQKTLIYVGVIIIALLSAGVIYTSISNSKGKKSLMAEKLASEKLLSEKLSVEKEMAKLQADFASLKKKDEANQKLLAETNIKIAASEKRINSLTSENRSLKTIKKELEDLKVLKASLEKEASKMKSDYDLLMAQNKELQNSKAALETEKLNLALQLEKANMYNSDNFLVTATRGKKTEKFVISASRTKKLNLAFEVPGNLTEGISFKMVTPSGTTINSDDKSMSWYLSQDARNYTASLSNIPGEFQQSRQVVLNYTAKTKLVKGEYKIQILTNGNVIGNCRIMLK